MNGKVLERYAELMIDKIRNSQRVIFLGCHAITSFRR